VGACGVHFFSFYFYKVQTFRECGEKPKGGRILKKWTGVAREQYWRKATPKRQGGGMSRYFSKRPDAHVLIILTTISNERRTWPKSAFRLASCLWTFFCARQLTSRGFSREIFRIEPVSNVVTFARDNVHVKGFSRPVSFPEPISKSIPFRRPFRRPRPDGRRPAPGFPFTAVYRRPKRNPKTSAGPTCPRRSRSFRRAL